MSDQRKHLATRFVEDFLNTADPAVFAELTTDDYADHDLPPGITPLASISAFRSGFPDARFEVRDVIADGDRVAVRYDISGTHTGDFFGMPASGTSVRLGGISLYRVRDGRLAEAWVQYDRAGLTEQLLTD